EKFPPVKEVEVRNIYSSLGEAEGLRIKQIEQTTNHDVKAVEYFVKEKLEALGLGDFKEFVHFGLTSQDINNTAIPLSVKEFMAVEYMPLLNELVTVLDNFAGEWKDIAMLARTHGQPASPTRLGKEISVFTARMEKQLELLNTIPFSAKFGGAT